jgi:hypothetical protein
MKTDKAIHQFDETFTGSANGAPYPDSSDAQFTTVDDWQSEPDCQGSRKAAASSRQ